MKYRVPILIVLNLIWGLIPLFTFNLFQEYSIFLILFIRLFVGGIALFLIAGMVAVILNYRNRKMKKTPLIRVTPTVIWNYLKAPNLDFYKMRQFGYIILLGFIGIDFQLIFYFWGLKSVGVIVTSIGYLVALLMTAFINTWRGKEEISGFKVIYLSILFVALCILGIVSQQQTLQPGEDFFTHFSWSGVLIATGYGIFMGIFFLTAARDQMTTDEYYYQRKERFYTSIRTFFKISIMFITGGILLIPLLFVTQYLPVPEDLHAEVTKFFTQFAQWPSVALLPNSIALVGLCTVTTFTGYYLLAAIWPKNSSFEMWAGIISLVEPIINIILGVTALGEPFPVSWLLIIIVLLLFGIIIRYLSESESQVQALLPLKIKFGFGRAAMVEAYKIRSVKRVLDVLGEDDIVLEIIAKSSSEFTKIIEHQIRTIPGLASYQVIMISEVEEDRGMPEKNKGDSIVKRMKDENK